MEYADDFEDDEPVEQPEDSPKKGRADHLAPRQFKKGRSGNPLGRHPGKSLKEYAIIALVALLSLVAAAVYTGLVDTNLWASAAQIFTVAGAVYAYI